MSYAHKAQVIVVSDRAATGVRPDVTAPDLSELLAQAGYAVAPARVVADDFAQIARAIIAGCEADFALLVTTGGTGLGPRDITPEATRYACDREVPGLAEQMRAAGRAKTPLAALSRAICATRGRTLVINTPGNPRGARESLEAILPLLSHALAVLRAEVGDEVHGVGDVAGMEGRTDGASDRHRA